MRRDRGFVLINALVVVAAVSALSVGMIRDATAGMDRLQAQRDTDRAQLALDAAATLARTLLDRDAETTTGDHEGEEWALDGETYALDGQDLTLTTEDLQGRFNMNLLLRPDAPAVERTFRALAKSLGVEDAAVEAILGHYADLRGTPALPPTMEGAPFASREIVLAEELRALPEVPQASVDRLAPAVSFLPEDAAINVNTAGEDVVVALLGLTDQSGWAAFDETRRAKPFQEVSGFQAALVGQFGQEVAERVDGTLVDVGSGWFRLRAVVRQDGAARAAVFLLHRPDSAATENVARIPEDA